MICCKFSNSFLSWHESSHSSNDFVCHAQVQSKLQISNPRFPLLLFTLSHTPAKNYTTALLISQTTLQSPTAANLIELHSSLLVAQDVQPTWPKVRKGNPPGANNNNHLVRKLHRYHRKCHAQRRKMTLEIIITKTIESISQPRLTCRCLHTQPFISRDMLRYTCSKPKGETSIQVIFTQSSVSMTTTSEYLACLRVQYTFSASVPVFTTTSVSGFTENKLQ